MDKKYLIIKTNNDYKTSRELDKKTYSELKIAAEALETFNTLAFLCNSYAKAKEDFLAYDFTQFGVREIDMFTMFLNALESMATNRNLWEAYLKRSFKEDDEIFPKGTKKSCYGRKDSEYYDKYIEYVVSKVLRNMIAHHSKPYSEIVYDDDLHRQFIVTKEDLLKLGNPNSSSKKYISESTNDYYDIVEIIKRAFEITDEINVYMFNLLLKKEWPRFISARYTVREHIGVDWQGAYIVKTDPRYPESHLLYLSQTSISFKECNELYSVNRGAKLKINTHLVRTTYAMNA